jgi:ABC-type uncharacterized transport system substrate-binding protein
VWADVAIEPLFDEGGRLTAVRERWTFDDQYTELIGPELDTSKDGFIQPVELTNSLSTALNWMIPAGYLTRVTVDGAPVAPQGAYDILTTYSGSRLAIAFTLRFIEALSPPLNVGVDVFDPTYYVAIDFADPAIDASRLPGGCEATRRPQPNLDPVAVMMLRKLGLTLDPAILADPAAGFPARVIVTCR